MPLSDLKLKNLLKKPPAKNEIISDRDGLVVRATASGTITFVYRYRYNRKSQQLKIGRYPDISLKQAREELPEFRRQLEQGLNPGLEKKTKIQANLEALTLLDCYDAFLDAHEGVHTPGTLKEFRTIRNHHLFKTTWPTVNNITVQHWFEHFDEYENPKRAQVAFRKAKAVLNWCYLRRMIDRPSILDIKSSTVGQQESVGDRVLTITETKHLVENVLAGSGQLDIKLCMLWIVLTACRQSEARELEWKDLDLAENVWTLPKEKSKTDEAVRRPIPDFLLQILEIAKTLNGNKGLVFRGRGAAGQVGDTSITDICRRAYKKMLIEFPNTAKFTPHDMRRTLSTRLSEEGVMPHVTEKMLGHVLGGVMAVYNKHDWLDDQAKAYEKWFDLIMPRSFLSQLS